MQNIYKETQLTGLNFNFDLLHKYKKDGKIYEHSYESNTIIATQCYVSNRLFHWNT